MSPPTRNTLTCRWCRCSRADPPASGGGPQPRHRPCPPAEPMAMAAAAAGADGIMIEVHNDPPHALCDGAQSLTPEQFAHTAGKIFRIREAMEG
ncbi:MAG: hypothetical protein ACLS43_08520 [Evtepia gabavorous]